MDTQLTDAIERCRHLPSTAGIAMRIIALAQDPDADIPRAAETLSLDVALAGRIMRLANSPLYASRRRIDNLNQAITMLGLQATLHLALGFSLIHPSSAGDSTALAHARLCHRSVLSAIAARLLGSACGVRQVDELMLAGLLQDIGALALLQIEPERYAALVHRHPANIDLLAAEMEHYGTDHAAIGEQLAQAWHLPESLARAIGHSERLMPGHDRFQRCISLSGTLADIWLSGEADRARDHARQTCRSWLDLPHDELDAILLQMETHVPDMAALFETRIPTPAALRGLLEEAAEIQLMRQLRSQQQAELLNSQTSELRQQAAELVEQARQDPLTGVTNRRYLGIVLEEEFIRAETSGQTLAVAFIDLDDFKKLNDRYGHIIGDQVLRAFARQVGAQLRATDTVARFGGEEFVVVFPATTEAQAAAIIRRVLELVSHSAVAEVDGLPLYVTFSAGIAAHGGDERFADAESLLRAADDALYRSKHLGRNRIQLRSIMREPID